MSRHAPLATIAAVAIAALFAGCGTAPADVPAPGVADVNYEGLATVRSRNFDTAQVRPGTDFRSYSRLIMGTPELAYRTPDSAERQLPLTVEQKDRFRNGLVSAFDDEFSDFQMLELVDEPGSATLALDIRVEDIAATVAPSAVGRAGRAAALLEASGQAVIIIELRDSQSNAILARGVDSGASSGGAMRTPEGELRARFESSEKVVEKWAKKTRTGIENLLREGR